MALAKYYRTLDDIKIESWSPTDLMDGFINRITNRLQKRDEDYRAVFVGNPGAGKSVSALSLCWLIDNDFNMDFCFFKPTKFVRFIKEASNNPKKYKGKMMLFDEAGVGMFSRDAQSKMNKMIALVSQTQRYLNMGIVYTLPSFDFLDVVVRKMVHQLFIMEKKVIYPINIYSYAVADVYDVLINPVVSSKNAQPLVLKKPKGRDKEGYKFYVKNLKIHLPPKRLLFDYSLKKKEEMASLYHSLVEQIESATKKGDDKKVEDAFRKIIKEVIKDLQIFVDNTGRISRMKVMRYFNCPREVADMVVEFFEKKKEDFEKKHFEKYDV
jgi:hypothetical protein